MVSTVSVPSGGETPAPSNLVTAPVAAPQDMNAAPPVAAAPDADALADAAVSAVVNGEGKLPGPTMRQSVASAVGTNPDAEAEARRVAARTGVPVQTVFARPDEMKRKVALGDIDFDAYEKMYPASALALSDVELAKIAHDDTENMGQQESVLKSLGTNYALSSAKMYQGLRAQIGDATGDKEMAQDAIRQIQVADFATQEATPQFDSSLARWTYGAASGLVDSAPALLATAINPLLAVCMFGAQAETTAYGKYRARGATPGEAALGGGAEGTVAAVTSFLPVKFLSDKLGKVGAGAFLTGLLARDLPAMEAQTIANSAIDTAIANPTKSWDDFVKELPENVASAATAAVVTAGTLTGVHAGAAYIKNAPLRRTLAEQANVVRAEKNAQDFEKLNALAAESKLKERDSLAFQNFIESVAQTDGAIENVYLDPRALAQAGISIEELAKASPNIAEQARVALEIGSDMKIPVSEYATHLAGTDLGQAVIDHLKTDPLGMSRAEAREFMQNHAERLKTDVEKTIAESAVDDKIQQSADLVREDLTRKLAETNRFTSDVNQQYAALLANFYKVQSARLGTTPEELYARHPVDIKSVTEGATLNQLRLKTKNPGDDIYAVHDLKHGRKTVGETSVSKDRFGPTLENIFVNPDQRGKGLGSEALNLQLEKAFSMAKEGKYLYTDVFNKQILDMLTSRLGEPHYTGDDFKEYKNTAEGRKILADRAAPDSEEISGGSHLSLRWDLAKANKAWEKFKTSKSITIDAKLLNQDSEVRRGSFNPDTSTISLLEKADLSTFLHESGHFFLETMNKLALDPNAPDGIKKDMQAVFDWLGVKDLTEWNSHDLEWQREKHEQFARGFESYLFEGRSPSLEMRGVFQRFRAWLLNVYQNLRSLDVELSGEVRGVFDRMLATTDQIKETELARSFEPMFSDLRAAGMNENEWREYQELGVKATQDAVTKLETRSMRDMKWLSNAKGRALKDLQREAAGRRREIREQVTDEIMSEPVNQARRFLTRGEFDIPDDANQALRRQFLEAGLGSTKLSLPALKEMYGEEANAPWRHFSTGKHGEVGTEGMHPDIVAQMFGFSSGDELVRALLAAEKPKERIAALTDQRMLEKYGDLTDPDTIDRAADEAVHNEARTRFVAAEMNALQRAVGGRKILTEAARRFAENMIDRLPIRDILPGRYSAAEARAARASAESFRAGGLVAAAVEKRNQLIQNYAARAAHAGLAEVEKALRYFKRLDRAGTREGIDVSALDQIDALLSRFDLRKGQTLKAIDNRKTLLAWKNAQEELGIEPEIPQELLDEAVRKHYKDMTLEEMRGLRDTIKQIEHLGKLKNRLLTAKDNRDFKATVDMMVDSINENAKGRVVDNRTRATKRGEVARLFKGFVASHRKVSSLARELDGIKDGGPVWDTLIRTMNESGDKEATMREKATIDLAKLIKPLFADGGPMGGKGHYFESIGKSLNREERIGMALNTGNLGNMQRLLDGEGWTVDQVRPVLDSLTKTDWDFVQNVWDFFETFRPEIGAKEKRVYGKQPDWIEPNPVQTQFGEYRGGYYPIKYDTRRSIAAEQHSDAEFAKQQMKGAYTSATTRRSFTKSRAEEVKGRPLLYAMDGLYTGVNEIIHDLSWHEWLIDANRLLRNKALDGAIRNGYGAEVVRQFKDSVRDIAGGEMPTGTSFERAIGDLRSGAVVAGLGINIMNAIINTTGITNSIVRVGPRWIAQGVGKFTANPRALTAEIHAKSPMMRLRSKTMLREINEIQSQVRGKSHTRAVMDTMMFAPMTFTQMAVDMPTWWGAYQKALTEGHADDKAVALADQSVLDSQSGGQVKDLAAIQRGGALQKLFTTFYGYFNASYNLGVERAKATDFKDPASVVRLGGDYLMLYTVPAVIGGLIKTALLGKEDDWEPGKLAATLANEQLSYIMGLMVGLREVGGAVQTVAGVNPYTSSYGGPAGLRFFQEIFTLATQIHQGEADDALRKSAINVAGIFFKLPASQINRTISGIEAIIDGDTDNPAAVVAGAPKK